MSEFSEQLLETNDRRVHEQLDLLAAAMHVQTVVYSDFFHDTLKQKSLTDRKKWIKESATMQMRELGYSPGFLQKRLLLHVFELYEYFYHGYTEVFKFKPETSLQEIQLSILTLAAAFLDNQFRTERLADVCSFLKQDISSIVGGLR